MFLSYLGSFFMGWNLGANDSSNVFGTAVSSRMVSFRTAVILTSIFVMIGALLQGHEGMHTLSGLTEQTMKTATIASFAAGLTVLGMTILRLPVSASQSMVGAIIGIGITKGQLNLGGLGKVVLCWVGTPLGGAFFAIILYYFFRFWVQRLRPSVFVLDPLIRMGLIFSGCYGAYALGANNVANVTGVFVGSGEHMMNTGEATLFGGLFIICGTITYSKGVMMTVGRGIVRLDAFSSLVTVLAHAITVHVYAIVGVPVSTSQAIVGSVLGIAVIKGAHTVDYKTLGHVGLGWLFTPVLAAFAASALYYLAHLDITYYG